MAVGYSLSDLVQELPDSALIELFPLLLLFLDHRLQVTAFCVVHHDVEELANHRTLISERLDPKS